MDNYIGKLLDNRYEILEVIGTGGMAVVYKARCHRLNRLVAVKILKDEFSKDEEFRRRFHAESQAVAMLQHPNIVSVYDVSRSDDADYIVMELIEGITLKQYLEKRGCLNWRETLHFSMQIAKALEHAHSRGIIHRDIKPHNIMILKDGSVKVADFGIARVASSKNTLTREALGSVHYISPEQAKGGSVDNRTDLYSLGVVMYEMLTGRTPYDGETPVSVAIQHINGMAELPSALNPDIPRGLEQITMHAMTAAPEQRYPSAHAMLLDMEEFRKNPVMLFDFSAQVASGAAAQPTQRRAQPRSAAEQYAGARTGGQGRPIQDAPQHRTQPTRRRTQEEQKKRMITTISVAVCAALVCIAAIVLLFKACGSEDDSLNVKVPKFVGMFYDELDVDDYPDLDIVFSFEPTAAGADGEIVAQSIDEGKLVRKGREIELVVCGYPDEDVKIDSFVGMKASDIKQSDYPLLYLEFEEDYDDEVAKGYVIRQSLSEGVTVKAGATLTIVVSLGKPGDIMPDLTEKTKASAEAILNRLDLELNIRFETEASDEVEEGRVTRTEPEAEAKLEKGDTVIVYLSEGKATDKMPELTSKTKNDATKALERLGLDLDIRYEEMESGEIEAGRVVQTDPQAGEELQRGDRVTLYISSGTKMVKVPYVTGYTESAASSMLRNADLVPVVAYASSDTVAEGDVISQSIDGGTQVEAGTEVTITVSTGKSVPIPQVKTVTIELDDHPTQDCVVELRLADGSVYWSQTVAAGVNSVTAEFSIEESLTLELYVDGVFVRHIQVKYDA